MKKTFILISLGVVLLCQNACADNLDDALTAWNTLVSSVKGVTIQSITGSAPIQSKDEWQAQIQNALDTMSDTLTLTIVDFNESKYDLSAFRNYDVSISAKGSVLGSTATVHYNFIYNSNYKMQKAFDDVQYKDRLNVEELGVFTTLQQKSQSICSQYSNDYGKEKAIHDFIAGQHKYGPLDTTPPVRAHQIIGLINDGQGVCEAYAQTFELMGKMCGLDTRSVTGTMKGTAHMWNIVKLDGEYYQVDVTGDDPTPDLEGRVMYTYFNLTDSQMAETHIWEANDYPQCNGTYYYYFTLNDLIATNRNELQSIIDTALANGETSFTFKTQGYVLNSTADISPMLTGKGFNSVSVLGDFGKDGVFNITLD